MGFAIPALDKSKQKAGSGWAECAAMSLGRMLTKSTSYLSRCYLVGRLLESATSAKLNSLVNPRYVAIFIDTKHPTSNAKANVQYAHINTIVPSPHTKRQRKSLGCSLPMSLLTI